MSNWQLRPLVEPPARFSCLFVFFFLFFADSISGPLLFQLACTSHRLAHVHASTAGVLTCHCWEEKWECGERQWNMEIENWSAVHFSYWLHCHYWDGTWPLNSTQNDAVWIGNLHIFLHRADVHLTRSFTTNGCNIYSFDWSICLIIQFVWSLSVVSLFLGWGGCYCCFTGLVPLMWDLNCL